MNFRRMQICVSLSATRIMHSAHPVYTRFGWCYMVRLCVCVCACELQHLQLHASERWKKKCKAKQKTHTTRLLTVRRRIRFSRSGCVQCIAHSLCRTTKFIVSKWNCELVIYLVVYDMYNSARSVIKNSAALSLAELWKTVADCICGLPLPVVCVCHTGIANKPHRTAPTFIEINYACISISYNRAVADARK